MIEPNEFPVDNPLWEDFVYWLQKHNIAFSNRNPAWQEYWDCFQYGARSFSDLVDTDYSDILAGKAEENKVWRDDS